MMYDGTHRLEDPLEAGSGPRRVIQARIAERLELITEQAGAWAGQYPGGRHDIAAGRLPIANPDGSLTMVRTRMLTRMYELRSARFEQAHRRAMTRADLGVSR